MYTSLELDALKEIGNIGAGNAATALSLLLTKRIQMKIPQVEFIPFDEVSNSIGGPENLVVGIFMRFWGDIDGNILLIVPKKDAYNLIKNLLNEEKGQDDNELSAMQESALLEMGNIVASSFISALSDFTRLQLKVSVPGIAFDMAGAILNFPLSIYGYMGDTAFLIDTEFVEGIDGVKIHFFLIPDDESLKVLLKAIGVSSIERNSSSGNGRV
jgi:chemotaxis protein CheC